MMPLIFVVDGVTELRSVVQFTLEQAGYRVKVFPTALAVDIAEPEHPSLILVALDLPGDGLALRDRIRQHPVMASTPIVLFTDRKINKQRLLEMSCAETCISYPFPPEELLKVVNDELQRTVDFRSRARADTADLVIDPLAMKISIKGKEVITTTLEFRLIDYLARHQGKVFTRDALLDAVWGDLRFVTPRSVDACIRRIRRKIEPESSSPRFLRTIRGVGYKLEATPTWEAAGGACQCGICMAARERARGVTSPDIEPGPRPMGALPFFPGGNEVSHPTISTLLRISRGKF